MTVSKDDDPNKLRRAAEARLRRKQASAARAHDEDGLSRLVGELDMRQIVRRTALARLEEQRAAHPVDLDPDDLARLVFELEVHQIELEMQNNELNEVQQALESALARYADLYDFAPVGYFTLARNSVILQANLSGACLLGTNRKALNGRRFSDFVAEESRADFAALMARAFSSNDQETHQIALLRNELHALPPYVHLELVLNEDHESVRAVAIDISAKRQSDKKLSQLSLAFEQAPLGVVICDLAGRIEYSNAAYARMSGYPSWETIGADLHGREAGPDAKALYAELWRALGKGEIWRGTLLNRRKNGDIYSESASFAPVREDDGRVERYIGIVEEIVQRG